MAKLKGSSNWTQFRVLSHKNLILAAKSWRGSLAQILTPLAITLLLVLFQFISNVILSREVLYPPVNPVVPLPHCVTLAGGPCKTLAYSPQMGWVEDLLRDVAHDAGLDFDETFVAIPGTMSDATYPQWCHNATTCATAFLRDNTTVAEWILQRPNQTQNVVAFQSAYFPPTIKELLPNTTTYTLYYNITIDQYPFFGDDHALELKRALDQAIMHKITGKDATLSVGWKEFPKPPPRLHGYNVVAQSGGTWYYVPAMIVFFCTLADVVAEKESKLRVGMAFMGMRSPPYWASWAFYALIFTVGSNVALVVSGYAAGFDLFTNASFVVLLIMFFLFGLAMMCLAFLISTLISSAATAQTVGYTIILVGFVFQVILSSQYGALIDLLFSSNVATWVQCVRWVLSFYPPFYFSKAFYDVATRASSIIDKSAGKVVQGPGYTWADLYKSRHVKFFNFDIDVPPTVQAFYWLLIDAVLFLTLAMYLDAVLPGDHGSPKHPLFFLFPEKWPRCCRRAPKKPKRTSGPRGEGVAEEARIAGMSPAPEGVAARISNLVKVYKRSWWACRGQDTTAVDGVSFTVREGEALALLGHNGAGKTTTISVLTGLFTATSGDVEVFGIDVNKDVHELQKVMGVCPQHDLLFGPLSAMQHLRMYARIKGVGSAAAVEREAKRLLAEVGLDHVPDAPVSTFSGGMKRRCSIAIACIGDVKVLLLDEPTTGLDPVNRRDAWRLIQRLKKGRAIILTTHQMEEADCLGDRVAVMANGRLKAIGTPLRLKSRYGKGYRLSVVLRSHEAASTDSTSDTDPESKANGDHGATNGGHATVDASREVMAHIQQYVPSAQLAARDAGNMAVVLPFDTVAQLPPLLAALENNETGHISEWGVSYATMEEVFLHITAEAGFELARRRHNSSTRSLTVNGEGGAPILPRTSSDVDTAVRIGGVATHAAGDANTQGKEKALLLAKTSAGTMGKRHSGRSRSGCRSRSRSRSEPRRPRRDGPPQSHTIRAVWRKNLTLQKRQKGQCFCQIATPVMVMAILILLQQVLETELGTSQATVVPALEVPLNANLLTSLPESLAQAQVAGSHFSTLLSSMIPGNTPASAEPSTLAAEVLGRGQGAGSMLEPQSWLGAAILTLSGVRGLGDVRGWQGVSDHDESSFDGVDEAQQRVQWAATPSTTRGTVSEVGGASPGRYPYDEYVDCLEFFLYSVTPSESSGQSPADLLEVVGHLSRTGTRSGLLGEMPQKNCRLRNRTEVTIPYFDLYGSAQEVDQAIYHDIDVLNNASLHDLQKQPPCEAIYKCPAYLTPDGSVDFRAATSTADDMMLDYVLSVNNNEVENYHRPNNFTRLGGFYNYSALPGFVKHQLLIITPARLALMDLVNNGFLEEVDATQPPPPFLTAFTLNVVATMPVVNIVQYMWIVDLFGSFLYPLALTLMLPLFTFVMVLEKEERLREMQKSMGMRQTMYYFANYSLNLGIYSVVAGFFWICGVILQFRFFDQTNFLLLFLFLLGWGMSLVAMGFFLCSFISSRRVATVVGYIICLFGNLVGIFFSDVVYGGLPPFSIGSRMPTPFLVFPVFSLVRGIFLMNYQCAADLVCIQQTSALDASTELGGIIISLFVCAFAYMALALYLEAVLPQQFGVRKHPLFCLRWCMPRKRGGSTRSSRSESEPGLRKRLLDDLATDDASDDEDVAHEKALVDATHSHRAPGQPTYTVLVQHLRKTFPTTPVKVAVADMCLRIPEDETFALLGENGAGKTTLINTLTGVFPPSSGSALIGGHDIREDMDAVHLVTGVCPQHDILWSTLTCEETLMFYARLKGVPTSEETEHVHRTLREVGLWGARHRLVRELSGGMKRRLSIGVALSGESQFIVVDEPTTGLDPASRRALWRILARARKGRSVLLTTHDMAEAETLATRIAIMTHGRLRCLGSQQHLKNKFGGGYRLFINYGPDASAKAIALIARLFPAAKVDAMFRGYATFLLPTGAGTGGDVVKIADVFRVMHEQSADAGVTDWGVGQVTLEDVFHRIVGVHNDDANAKRAAYGSGQARAPYASAGAVAGSSNRSARLVSGDDNGSVASELQVVSSA